MDLTILGSSAGGVPGPGNAGSGYLLREGGTNLLLDCGNGVLGELAKHLPPERIDGVYVSHLHFDHLADLRPFLLQRTRFTPLAIHGPPGTREAFDAWFRMFTTKHELYSRTAAIAEYEPRKPLHVGSLSITPLPVEHNAASFGCVVEAGGSRLAYSSDTRMCPGLLEVARDAELFLCEATLQEDLSDRKFLELQLGAHMTAKQAGEAARDSGACRLLLTHWMYYLDLEKSVREARGAFPGPIEVARPGGTFQVGSGRRHDRSRPRSQD